MQALAKLFTLLGISHRFLIGPNSIAQRRAYLSSISVAALARRTFVRPQSVHDTLRSLEAKGYIERHSTSKTAERVISITTAGVKLMRELEPRVGVLDSALCDDFSEADEDLLRTMLRRVRTNAGAFQG